MTPTSTIISTWAPDMLNYIWDSVAGFFYEANGKEFIVVFIILIGVVTLVIAGVKYVLPSTRYKKPFD